MVPPAFWMIRDLYRSCNANTFVANLFVTLMLLAFCLPGFEFRASSPGAGVLTHAVASLSETDLRYGCKS
jgi:hypothetical protein